MGCVAGKKDAPLAEPLCHHRAESVHAPAINLYLAGIGMRREQLVDALIRQHVVVRFAIHQHPLPAALAGRSQQGHGRSCRVAEKAAFRFAGELSVDGVHDQPLLRQPVTAHLYAQCLAHGRATAIAGHQEIGRHGIGITVYRLHRRRDRCFVLPEIAQRRAVADLNAIEAVQPGPQLPLQGGLVETVLQAEAVGSRREVGGEQVFTCAVDVVGDETLFQTG